MADRVSPDPAVAQGLPWLSWGAIDWLNTHLKPGMRVFEWGGGGSTIFFASRGCSVVTVESNRYWRDQLQQRLAHLDQERWELRFIEADSNQHPRAEEYIDSVSDGGPWDVVLVDGWNRQKCFWKAMPAIASAGALVIDNADKYGRDLPGKIPAGWKHLPFRGVGPARARVTQTDVYVRV
jgi:predicted O-methyltransferase YrrM